MVCATPIGNLADVTLRVLDALRDADTVLAEDTRVTRKLLSRYAIEATVERYDENTAQRRTPEIIERIEAGETFALVSDAGTPGLSDPGTRLVQAGLAAGIAVEVLPGASAVAGALVASGMPTHAFYFGGFLPRKAGERRKRLLDLAGLDATLVFFESPKRTATALAAVAEMVPGRDGAVVRELTKLHEEVARGTVAELAEQFAERSDLKGEVVIVIGPAPPAVADVDEAAVSRRIGELRAEGLSTKDAIREVSRETGLPRNAVYSLAHSKDERLQQ